MVITETRTKRRSHAAIGSREQLRRTARRGHGLPNPTRHGESANAERRGNRGSTWRHDGNSCDGFSRPAPLTRLGLHPSAGRDQPPSRNWIKPLYRH